LFTSCIISRKNENTLIKKEGIYIFDNQIDTLFFAKNFESIIAEDILDSIFPDRETNKNLCYDNKKTLDGTKRSTYIGMLYFINDSIGNIDWGVCREKKYLLNAITDIESYHIKDKSKTKKGTLRVLSRKNNEIVFTSSDIDYFKEIYSCKISENKLIANVKREIAPDLIDPDLYRIYHYYSFKKIKALLKKYKDTDKIYFKSILD